MNLLEKEKGGDTDLLEEVVHDHDHSPPEVLSAHEIDPRCLVNFLVESISDCLQLGLAAPILGIGLWSQTDKRRDSILATVLR